MYKIRWSTFDGERAEDHRFHVSAMVGTHGGATVARVSRIRRGGKIVAYYASVGLHRNGMWFRVGPDGARAAMGLAKEWAREQAALRGLPVSEPEPVTEIRVRSEDQDRMMCMHNVLRYSDRLAPGVIIERPGDWFDQGDSVRGCRTGLYYSNLGNNRSFPHLDDGVWGSCTWHVGRGAWVVDAHCTRRGMLRLQRGCRAVEVSSRDEAVKVLTGYVLELETWVSASDVDVYTERRDRKMPEYADLQRAQHAEEGTDRYEGAQARYRLLQEIDSLGEAIKLCTSGPARPGPDQLRELNRALRSACPR